MPLLNTINAKWEVRRVYNGNIYPPDSVYKPGNGNILQFKTDSTYQRYAHGTITATGAYHIRKNGYKLNQNYYDKLYLGADTTFKWFINITGDKMTLKPLMPDLPTTDYQKLTN